MLTSHTDYALHYWLYYAFKMFQPDGSVDYSWGADGLAEATAFVGTMMIYTVEILYAVAGIVVIVAALQIGIKMNYHEGDITKSMMMLFGGILFMIGASIVMPALFGYQDMNFVF